MTAALRFLRLLHKPSRFEVYGPDRRPDRICDLYHAALKRPPAERSAFPFQTDLSRENNRPYDVTRDGQRFLVPTIQRPDDFRFVLNCRALVPR